MSNEAHTPLKRRLFGLSPKKVSSYLLRMKNLQAEKRAELEEKVQAQQEMEALLQAELSECEARSIERAELKKYQDFILQRAEEAAQVLRVHTQQQLLEMQKAVDQKQEEHRQTILLIDQQINSYNQLLQSLLQEFDTTLHQFSASSLDGLLAVVDHTLPLQTETPDAADVSTKVVPLKLKPLPVQTAAVEQNGSFDFETSETVTRPPALRIQDRIPLVRQKNVSSAFWGDMDSFLESEDVPADFGDVHEEQASARLIEDSEDWHMNGDANEVASPTAPAFTDRIKENRQKASKESEGVTSEIASIRNRYIVGKVAGADLFDQQGKRIIAQGERITAELVELAEREGKLPDLIVNMKVQGLDQA